MDVQARGPPKPSNGPLKTTRDHQRPPEDHQRPSRSGPASDLPLDLPKPTLLNPSPLRSRWVARFRQVFCAFRCIFWRFGCSLQQGLARAVRPCVSDDAMVRLQTSTYKPSAQSNLAHAASQVRYRQGGLKGLSSSCQSNKDQPSASISAHSRMGKKIREIRKKQPTIVQPTTYIPTRYV